MKICFYTTNKNISTGSYRIWSHDLNLYLNENGHDSIEVNNASEITDCDVIILSKNDASAALPLKKAFPNKLVGTINTAADVPKIDCDFVIVGSLEEKASLSRYSNVFYFPLIERMNQPEELYKSHEQKEELIVGFHGSFSHISNLGFQNKAILKAIKEFSEEQKVILKIITNPEASLPPMPDFPRWKTKIIPWNYRTITKNILDCDIGIVPNIGYLPLSDLKNPENNSNKGYYASDYLLRFKNKSNAGRSFVFHQLGIPVVTDLTPSNFHIMGSGECGHIVYGYEGWLNAFRDLNNHKKRQIIADTAKEEFDRLYNPHAWADKLYNQIKGIKK